MAKAGFVRGIVILLVVFCAKIWWNSFDYCKAVSYVPYLEVVQNVEVICEKQKEFDVKSESKGFLFDFNKDGIKELVISYWKYDGCCTNNCYVDVYTIRKATVNRLKHLTVISDEADSCFFGVATQNGINCLYVNMEMEFMHQFDGWFRLYQFNGKKMFCQSKVTYSKLYSEKKKRTVKVVKVNKKKSSFAQLVQWLKKYQLRFVSRKKSKTAFTGFTYKEKMWLLKKIKKKVAE